MTEASSIEEHFDRCLDLVMTCEPEEFTKACSLLGDVPMLSYIEATMGRFGLDELAIEFDFDSHTSLTKHLSSLHAEYSVGMVEWILLVGEKLMKNGHSA